MLSPLEGNCRTTYLKYLEHPLHLCSHFRHRIQVTNLLHNLLRHMPLTLPLHFRVSFPELVP